jgi:hypothetical protein
MQGEMGCAGGGSSQYPPAGSLDAVSGEFQSCCDTMSSLLQKLLNWLTAGHDSAADLLESLMGKMGAEFVAEASAPETVYFQLERKILSHVSGEAASVDERLRHISDRIQRTIDQMAASDAGQLDSEQSHIKAESSAADTIEVACVKQPIADNGAPPSYVCDIPVATPAEVDRYAPPKPLPQPAPPLVAPFSPSDAMLLTQCRPDLYALPRATLEAAFPYLKSSGGEGLIVKQVEQLLNTNGSWLASIFPGGATEIVQQVAQGGARSAINAVESVANLISCGTGLGMLLPVAAVLDAMGQYISPSIPRKAMPLYYALNAACPVEFPSPSEGDAAFLANAISEEVLKSWVQIDNKCWEPHKAVLEAKRSKLNPGELLQLVLRKEITEQSFSDGLRALGFTKQGDSDLLRKLGEFIPPYSDQVRFMVRDAHDETLVQKFKLDEAFEQKFTSEAKHLAESLGITEQTMRWLWRAHWSIPAPGQLANMFHRLPLVRDAEINQFNAALADAGFSIRVDRGTFAREKVLEDVVTAMAQQDIAPYWIPRLLSLTYRPLTLRDARRAFEIGALSRQALKDNFRALGYTEEHAESLTKFAENERNLKAANHEAAKLFRIAALTRHEAAERMKTAGYPAERIAEVLGDIARTYTKSETVEDFREGRISRETAMEELQTQIDDAALADKFLTRAAYRRRTHPVIDAYAAGLVDRDEALAEIGRDMLPRQRIVEMFDKIDYKEQKEFFKTCAKNVCERYQAGELMRAAAQRELLAYGMTPRAADMQLARCDCARKSRGKEFTAGQLCTGFEQGLIDPDDFADRLLRIGYSPPDAARVIRSCQLRGDERRQREADAAAKRLSLAARQREAAAEKQRKSSAKQAAAMEKAREASRLAGERRERRLVAAADRLRGTAGVELDDAMKWVRSAAKMLATDFPFGATERVEIIEQAIKGEAPAGAAEFGNRVRAVAIARVESAPIAG